MAGPAAESDAAMVSNDGEDIGAVDAAVQLKKMPEALVRVWLAELIVAVEALHERGIICGDLGLNNVLLGEKGAWRISLSSDFRTDYQSDCFAGRIKLTYFSQWNSVVRNREPARQQPDYHRAPGLLHIPIVSLFFLLVYVFSCVVELKRVGEDPSSASDVWSLGVIAFDLLTGQVRRHGW